RGVLVDVAYELLVRVLDPDERHRYRDVSAREHRKLGPGRGDTDAGYLIDAVQSRVGEQHPVAVGEGLPVNGDRRAGGQDTREGVDHLYLGDHIVSKLQRLHGPGEVVAVGQVYVGLGHAGRVRVVRSAVGVV